MQLAYLQNSQFNLLFIYEVYEYELKFVYKKTFKVFMGFLLNFKKFSNKFNDNSEYGKLPTLKVCFFKDSIVHIYSPSTLKDTRCKRTQEIIFVNKKKLACNIFYRVLMTWKTYVSSFSIKKNV